MNYFGFKVWMKYRVYHKFTLCLTELCQMDRIIFKTFNEVISRIDNLLPDLLKYVPNAEVMLSIGCCFFFYPQFLCAILCNISAQNNQLPNETAIHVPNITRLCGEVEPVNCHVVVSRACWCSLQYSLTCVYFYEKMFFYCVINVCKVEEKERVAQKSRWLIYILCINAFPK